MNSYPRELHVDLSKLRATTLKRYAWYFKLDSSSALQPELASNCAKHFQSHLSVDEAQVLSNFEAYVVNPNSVRRTQPKRPLDEPPAKKRRHATVADGRLVVAKVNDNWILGKTMKYLKRKKVYRVEDADEMTKERGSFEIPQEHVIALPTEHEAMSRKSYPKGARVLARFPKTSTFYPATVVKRQDRRYQLRFDDDERGPDGHIRIVKVDAHEVVSE